MTYVQGPATTGSGNLEANKLESGQTSTPDSTSILEIFYAYSRLDDMCLPTVVPKEVSENLFFFSFLLIFFYWCVVWSRFFY